MNFTKFYDDALGFVKEAVEADTGKDFRRAVDLYDKAVDRFITGLKCACHCGGGRRWEVGSGWGGQREGAGSARTRNGECGGESRPLTHRRLTTHTRPP
jgi:hypothetical protein